VKARFAGLSIQRKLFSALAGGFGGFLFYFAANLAISSQNGELMNALIEKRLPMLEASEMLGQSLGLVKGAIVQSAFSGSMDAISGVEASHRQVIAAFTRLEDLFKSEDLGKQKVLYLNAYNGANEVLQNVVAGLDKVSAVQATLQQHTTSMSTLEKWAIELKGQQTAAFRASIDSANSGNQRSMMLGWILVLGGIPFAIFFYFLTRDVSNGLQAVSGRLAEASHNMISISNEASASSFKLATSSTQQSTAVVESVASMEQMKSMLAQTVENSTKALNSSEKSFRAAADGKVVIDNLRTAMLDIERSYEQLEEINDVVRMIRSKTNIINDIVFKTQLLSFNASIEAARAGLHGRGFAVVAAEVGKLAEMSGIAAQEIDKLLDTSTKKVAHIVDSTKDKVQLANSMSQRCATVFEGITERAGEVKTMVNSITHAASEQESGIHMVGQAMSEVKGSADETDEMAQVISAISGNLKGHALSLASSIESLDSLVHGSRDRENGIKKAA
jgi:methyl-accepting chemotaxis protein